MNIKSFSSIFLFYVALTQAHEGHSNSKEPISDDAAQYAQRHMATEHHIESFDLPSFFQLHDLNRDGVWDAEEVEAIYGVHHVYSQKKSKDDEEHQKKAKLIVDTIFDAIDKDKDGKIALSEFEAAGLAALPSFENLGAEGHHYDVESEFFLHHEEQFHSTPETQDPATYNHPEDIEHFSHHEVIDHQEAERVAIYQGISVEEALAQHAEPAPSEQPPVEQANVDDREVPKRFERTTPPEQQEPAVRFRQAMAESESHGEWGSGEGGYKPPNGPSERMRKNLPYKERMQYKFRRNWGDF
ncbi:precursor to secretory protein Ssp120 [Russula compacta]|nr:precursor to secretory protein Ssp120 [Russula compacta]